MAQSHKSSQYWLDVEVGKILEAIPEGEIVVSSGISPSATYHIGHFPEILNAEALAWGLRRAGRQARHIHVVDNMDPLRKRYDFLPKEYEQFVGRPICLVPNPYGEGSYADHFFNEFSQYFDRLGINPDSIVKSYEDLYCSGQMTGQFERVLDNIEEVKAIFAQFGREVAADWTPIQVLDDDGVFVNARPGTWDKEAKTIEGVDYTSGKAKLNWRLDWPARWAVLGVDVEPFNVHEHGAAGGSYDTGVEFARRIFNVEAPVPGARYGNIHLGDDPKKMSSSKGNLISPEEALKIIPPSLLRYFVIRSRPQKPLHFHTDDKLASLVDEFKQVSSSQDKGQEHEFAEAFNFADIGDRLTTVPFSHLVAVYQAALKDTERTLEILQRTGYEADEGELEAELYYVENWLQDYASERVRFQLQQDMPESSELSQAQKGFLSDLADSIASRDELGAEWVHETIYSLKDRHDLAPAQAFQSIYWVLLGQNSGPKAGWFLATIDRDWLLRRLKLEA